MTAFRSLALGVLVSAALVWPAAAGTSAPPPSPATAAVMTPGPFTLKTTDGAVVDAVDLDGRPYGLFFGFTHCPDVCPTTLAELTVALGALGEKAAKFPIYFVAIDAERDTPEALAAFLGAFDSRIVGLRGSPEEVAAAAAAFGAVARKLELPGGSFTMEHTAALFLVDSNGVIADRVAYAEPSAAMANRIAAVAGR